MLSFWQIHGAPGEQAPSSSPSLSAGLLTNGAPQPAKLGHGHDMEEIYSDAEEYQEERPWDKPYKYTLYLPGVCIHVAPTGPRNNEELHWQQRSFPGLAFEAIVVTVQKTPLCHTLGPLYRISHLSDDSASAHLPCLQIAQNLACNCQVPIMSAPTTSLTEFPVPKENNPDSTVIAKLICADKAFENTSTSVAASQMRNALNNLADTVEDPKEKKVCLRAVHTTPNTSNTV